MHKHAITAHSISVFNLIWREVSPENVLLKFKFRRMVLVDETNLEKANCLSLCFSMSRFSLSYV